MAQFGTTVDPTVTPTTAGNIPPSYKLATRFLAPESGEITSVTALTTANNWTTQPFPTAIVYSDNNGVPNQLLGQSQPTQVGTLNAYVFNFTTPIPIVGGNYYWLGLTRDTVSSINPHYVAGLANQTAYNVDAAPPDALFGTPSYYSREFMFIATYTPTGGPTYAVAIAGPSAGQVGGILNYVATLTQDGNPISGAIELRVDGSTVQTGTSGAQIPWNTTGFATGNHQVTAYATSYGVESDPITVTLSTPVTFRVDLKSSPEINVSITVGAQTVTTPNAVFLLAGSHTIQTEVQPQR